MTTDTEMSLWFERSANPAWGLFGGQDGAPPEVIINPGHPPRDPPPQDQPYAAGRRRHRPLLHRRRRRLRQPRRPRPPGRPSRPSRRPHLPRLRQTPPPIEFRRSRWGMTDKHEASAGRHLRNQMQNRGRGASPATCGNERHGSHETGMIHGRDALLLLCTSL